MTWNSHEHARTDPATPMDCPDPAIPNRRTASKPEVGVVANRTLSRSTAEHDRLRQRISELEEQQGELESLIGLLQAQNMDLASRVAHANVQRAIAACTGTVDSLWRERAELALERQRLAEQQATLDQQRLRIEGRRARRGRPPAHWVKLGSSRRRTESGREA
jgi:hypothetical protein